MPIKIPNDLPARVVLDNAELDIVISGANAAQKFTLVKDAVFVEGEFNNLPEGAKFTRNNRRFHITYQAGASGRDIAIDCIQTGALFMVR